MSFASQFNPTIRLHIFLQNLKKLLKCFLKNHYTCEQSLMMAYEVTESARDNFCKFINLKTKQFSGNLKGC